MGLAAGGEARKGRRSFLKKRTKKPLLFKVGAAPPRAPTGKSFCFFFQKEALPSWVK
jgi:hypothetical protein